MRGLAVTMIFALSCAVVFDSEQKLGRPDAILACASPEATASFACADEICEEEASSQGIACGVIDELETLATGGGHPFRHERSVARTYPANAAAVIDRRQRKHCIQNL